MRDFVLRRTGVSFAVATMIYGGLCMGANTPAGEKDKGSSLTDLRRPSNKKDVLKFGPNESSMFDVPNTTWYIYIKGVSGATWSHFNDHDGLREFEHPSIVDAEKRPDTNTDDLWCEHMVHCNLLTWCGWGQKLGFQNEDSMADYFVSNPNQLKDKMPMQYAFDKLRCDMKKYERFRRENGRPDLMRDIADMCKDGYAIYIQLDWGKKNHRQGSHAVTCYGYQGDRKYAKSSWRHYTGLLITNSDNHKHEANPPNTITLLPLEWDETDALYYLSFPLAKVGSIRFAWGLHAR